MKKIEQLRLFNKYTLTSCIFLICILFISLFFSSGMYYWIFVADFQTESDLIGKNPRETVLMMLNQLRGWELYIDFATRYTIYFIPIFPLLPILQFYNEKKGYLSYASIRMKNFKKHMLHNIIKYAVISGLCVVLPYIVFFSIGNIFMIDHISTIGNYLDILGPSFYNNHPFLSYIFITFSIYFAIGFTFGISGIAIALWTDKSYLIIVIPIVYYIVIGNLAEAFNLPLLNIMHSVTAFNTLYNTFEIFVPLLLPLILSITLILYKYKKGDVLDS